MKNQSKNKKKNNQKHNHRFKFLSGARCVFGRAWSLPTLRATASTIYTPPTSGATRVRPSPSSPADRTQGSSHRLLGHPPAPAPQPSLYDTGGIRRQALAQRTSPNGAGGAGRFGQRANRARRHNPHTEVPPTTGIGRQRFGRHSGRVAARRGGVRATVQRRLGRRAAAVLAGATLSGRSGGGPGTRLSGGGRTAVGRRSGGGRVAVGRRSGTRSGRAEGRWSHGGRAGDGAAAGAGRIQVLRVSTLARCLGQPTTHT